MKKILKFSIIVLSIAMSISSFAMRCTRKPVARPAAHVAQQQCLPRVQRSYSTDSMPNKYHSRLIHYTRFKKDYLHMVHLMGFTIETPLLKHLMVHQKIHGSALDENQFGILQEMVRKKNEDNNSIAYRTYSLYGCEAKVSLWKLLANIYWDGSVQERNSFEEPHPQVREFPILVNEKEVKLTVLAYYDSRKSHGPEDLFFVSTPGFEEDPEHHEKVMKKYTQLFEGKL